MSLAVQAAPTVLRTAGLSRVADLCEHTLGPLAPGGAPVGVGAALTAAVVPVLAGRSLLRVRRARRAIRLDPEVGWHGQLGGHEQVVLPSGEPVAFSSGGRPGQVVVSRGLIEVLSDDQLAAVLRHEVAHVRHRHQRYLLVARAVERSLGLLPLVRRGSAAVCCAVERWADEETAGGGAAGRASVQAAPLLRVAQARATPEVAAFTSPGTLLERLEALDADPAGGAWRWRVDASSTSQRCCCCAPRRWRWAASWSTRGSGTCSPASARPTDHRRWVATAVVLDCGGRHAGTVDRIDGPTSRPAVGRERVGDLADLVDRVVSVAPLPAAFR